MKTENDSLIKVKVGDKLKCKRQGVFSHLEGGSLEIGKEYYISSINGINVYVVTWTGIEIPFNRIKGDGLSIASFFEIPDQDSSAGSENEVRNFPPHYTAGNFRQIPQENPNSKEAPKRGFTWEDSFIPKINITEYPFFTLFVVCPLIAFIIYLLSLRCDLKTQLAEKEQESYKAYIKQSFT